MRSHIRILRHAVIGLVAVAGSVAVAVPPAAADPGPAVLPHPVGGVVISGDRVSAASTARVGIFEAPPASASLAANMPTPGDQGQIGSCVSWSIAYAIMGYYARRDSGTGAPYAPLYLYMRTVSKGGAPNAGTNPETALTEATNNGVDTQADYVQGTSNWQTAPTTAEIANAANYKLTGWKRLWVGDNQGTAAATAVKTAIAAGSPVSMGIPVYRDFMSLNSAKLYNTLSGSSLGGHMITVYGYDAEGVWIRNSWGTMWGASGDAHLSWAFVNSKVQAAYTANGISTPASNEVGKPTVAALSVRTGPTTGGTEVTISGTNLAAATAVRFGDTAATFKAVTTKGVTTLVAKSPARAKGVVDVTVTNASGTSATAAGTTFTYVPAAPAVTGLSSTTTSMLGGATIRVTGTAFTGATRVTLGSAVLTPVVQSDTALTVVVPDTLPAGTVDVRVTTPYGTSVAVPADRLTLAKPAAPTISGLSVSSGPVDASTEVVISGANFYRVSAVTAQGKAITYTVLSDQKVKVVLPPHAAGQVKLKIVALGGTVDGATFTYAAKRR